MHSCSISQKVNLQDKKVKGRFKQSKGEEMQVVLSVERVAIFTYSKSICFGRMILRRYVDIVETVLCGMLRLGSPPLVTGSMPPKFWSSVLCT